MRCVKEITGPDAFEYHSERTNKRKETVDTHKRAKRDN